MGSVLNKMLRRKSLESVTADTTLHRCLGVCDLTLMGIGSMVGSGIYIMTGIAAKESAGPGIVVAFLLAAVVILMVMACFTELASRLHRTGSTYLYIYLTMGELPAFIMGFASLLLIILGGATNGRAWSAYLDSVFKNAISNYTITHIGKWELGSPIAEYPDFMAAGVILLFTLVVVIGAKCSARFMGFFAGINVLILIFTSVVGFIYADITNWTNPDTGGFLPFGWFGLIKASATCFWAFSGFEVISMAVEEARNTKRDIPLSTGLVMFIVTILYVSTSAAITLITSYKNLDKEAPLPSAFAARGVDWAHYIVAIGPMCGLTTTMVGSLYGFGRMAYAVADDGLLFSIFAKVNDCSQVPVFSIVLSGILMAVFAIFLDLSEIITFSVNMVLIGYCIVAVCVIMLHYNPQSTSTSHQPPESNSTQEHELLKEISLSDEESSELTNGTTELETLTDNKDSCGVPETKTVPGGTLKPNFHCLGLIFGFTPGRWPALALGLMVLAMALLSALVVYGGQHLEAGEWWAVTLACVLFVIILLLLLSICTHQQNLIGLDLKVPCVPLIPSLSLLCCLLLLFSNSTKSGWIGTLTLFLVGIVIYFSYGIHHSKLGKSYTPVGIQKVSSEDEAAVGLLEAAAEDEDEL